MYLSGLVVLDCEGYHAIQSEVEINIMLRTSGSYMYEHMGYGLGMINFLHK